MLLARSGSSALGILLLLVPAEAAAQERRPTAPPVEYELSFDNAAHHEARIHVTYRNAGTAPLQFQMSRSSPGRYALHEFAKNVYAVSAVDGAGRTLAIQRSDPYSWTIAGHDGTVRLSYTLFADRADGTYSQVDLSHAHLNMPATLMWARGFDERPVHVRFRPLDSSWKVATQLAATKDPFLFTAPNFQYLMDSPAELSALKFREWRVQDGARTRTIRLAVHHLGTDAEVDRLAEKARKVVTQQIATFGDVPDYDTGTYTFIVDALPWADGDGMEHRNSTVITGSRGLAESGYSALDTISHEFFHGWSVERLRPDDLEPFDFTRANPTSLLWFAEGFTSYYGPLFVRRAGESSLDTYLASLSRSVSFVTNSSGRRFGSPEEMSLRAPFIDAATSVDPATPNIVTNYYPYGAVLGLALDLMLRQRGQSLDAYMRHMWRSHGVAERPFTTADLERRLAELAGDPAFAARFFASHVRGSALPDLTPLLAQAGLVLRPSRPGAAHAGTVELQTEGAKVVVADYTVPGSPLYAAGIDKGDVILMLGSTPIASAADWNAALGGYKPGQSAEVRFLKRGQERRAELRFTANPALEIVPLERTGARPTPAQHAFRSAWLGKDSVARPL